MTENELYKVFEDNGLYMGRTISGGKTAPKGHIAVWNGNIITKKRGKIWYGDLNLTKEVDQLKTIAKTLGEDLYILTEHDARFAYADAGFRVWKKKAVEIIKCK